jgi:hypothetical protein
MSVELLVMRARGGGGSQYETLVCWHQVMAEESARSAQCQDRHIR